MTDADLHRLRHGVHRVAAAGFGPASAPFVQAAAGTPHVLADLGLFDFSFAPHVLDLLDAVAAADPDELDRAHRSVFDGRADGVPLIVRESVFRGDTRTGESARILADAVAAQRALDVEPDPNDPDHAMTELGSMSESCRKLAAVDEPADGLALLHAQNAFLRAHLLRWLPALGRDLAQPGHHPVHRALGRATISVLEHERQFLPHLIRAAEEAKR